MHQTRSDLNIVLTHTEDLSTSERYKVTVAYQELIQPSFPVRGIRITFGPASNDTLLTFDSKRPDHDAVHTF